MPDALDTGARLDACVIICCIPSYLPNGGTDYCKVKVAVQLSAKLHTGLVINCLHFHPNFQLNGMHEAVCFFDSHIQVWNRSLVNCDYNLGILQILPPTIHTSCDHIACKVFSLQPLFQLKLQILLWMRISSDLAVPILAGHRSW